MPSDPPPESTKDTGYGEVQPADEADGPAAEEHAEFIEDHGHERPGPAS